MSVLNLKLSLRRRPISGEPLYYEINGVGGLWETVTLYASEERVKAEIADKAASFLLRSGKDRYVIETSENLAYLVD